MKILHETIWGNFLWFDSKCAPLSLKWEAGSWGMISEVTGKGKCCLWRRRYPDTMIWLIPMKAVYYSVVWSRIHCSHVVLPGLEKLAELSWPLLGTQQLKDGPTRAHKSQGLLCISHIKQGHKSPLCSCFSFSTLSLLTKPGCLSPYISLELCPTGIVSESLFSPGQQPCVAPRLRVGPCSSWPCEASTLHPAGVGRFSVLDSLFSVFLSFSLSSLGLSTSQISSVELYSLTPETLRVLFRDAGSAGNAHAYGAECLVTAWLLEMVQSQTAPLSFASILNKRQSSFFLNFWQRQVR